MKISAICGHEFRGICLVQLHLGDLLFGALEEEAGRVLVQMGHFRR